MEPLLVIGIPGVLGGIVLALFFIRFGGGPSRETDDARLDPPSTNMINMARIRVSGVGGLGMVAMAVTVAIFVPRIRLTMIIALLLGAAMAALMIAFRRRTGSLPSSTHPGAHAMLPFDTPVAPDGSRSASRDHGQDLAIVPAEA